MYDPKPWFDALSTWQKAGAAYGQMLMSANEVIWHRTTRMALGTMTPKEAAQMVFEKPAAFAKAMEKAAVASAAGQGTAAAALASTLPIRARTTANAKRLRRR